MEETVKRETYKQLYTQKIRKHWFSKDTNYSPLPLPGWKSEFYIFANFIYNSEISVFRHLTIHNNSVEVST